MSASRTRRALVAAAAIGLSALGGGCGSSSTSTPSSAAATSSASSATSSQTSPAAAAGGSTPTVLAAASLTKVFPQIDPSARYTFGGSGMLAIQIEQGAPADVYAAASPKDPAALYAKKLLDKPIEFATNRLVLIVPRANPAHINSVNDITKPRVKLVICNATVPCGDYARKAFTNLGIANTAMKNVVSQTTDVTQAVAEVALGQADAGFVYVTDADAAKGRVSVVGLPAKAKPDAEDFVAVVKAAKHPASAQAFVKMLLSAPGQAKLEAAGFGKP